MAEDWAIDVKKYVPDADDGVIAAIVRYCGIALQSRDSSLVSFTDKTETDRVRENYCKKKLGLTNTDAELDTAIAAVGERMKEDTTRNRVTVYYLLAEHFGKLGLFGAAAAATAAVAEPVTAAPQPVMSEPAPAPTAAQTLAAKPLKDDGDIVRTGLIAAGVLAAILIGAGVIGTIIGNRVDTPAVAPPPAPAAPYAPAVAAPAIPEGAGIVAVVLVGKPKLSVYFDTAKADVTPDVANEVGDLKTYLEANPTARLGVSGYNDPRGNAAFNAELSKNRAQNVAAELAKLGLPADRIDLIKPIDTTDDVDTLANARRVDVYVQE
jgi:outer membrane protein OmpA-like peptidoglycan-associated protein